jgi:hypothetical protein
VTTQISVSVAASEQAALESGAQNVIGLTNGPADPANNANAYVNPRSFLGGPDTGAWNIQTLASRNTAAHEFTHLLGVGNKPGDNLSNKDPQGRPLSATSADFRWALRGVVRAHHQLNRMFDVGGFSGFMLTRTPRTTTSTQTVRAPFFWWR